MKELIKKFPYIAFFTFGLIFGLIMLPVSYFSYEILFGVPIQIVSSQNHRATLRPLRTMLGYRLAVEVDGKRVFKTGKTLGISERQLRAVLVWDTTGRIVAFERMGKIYFAYDADEKREIKEDELKNYCLSPMSEDYTLKNPSCKTEK